MGASVPRPTPAPRWPVSIYAPHTFSVEPASFYSRACPLPSHLSASVADHDNNQIKKRGKRGKFAHNHMQEYFTQRLRDRKEQLPHRNLKHMFPGKQKTIREVKPAFLIGKLYKVHVSGLKVGNLLLPYHIPDLQNLVGLTSWRRHLCACAPNIYYKIVIRVPRRV